MALNIEHFTHPGHSLAGVYESEEFQCDGCKTPGNGPRYRCHTCNFNMHEYCGVCPSTLSTFMHPQHHLKLATRTQGRRHICDLCGDNVEGLFYRCTLCDFDIHPLCTKLPESLPHALHRTHSLKLQASSSGWCRVCKRECTSWRYRCGICSFDIDLECALAEFNTPTTSRSVGAPTPPPPPPYGIAPPPPTWGVYGGLPLWGVYGGLPPWGVFGGLPPCNANGPPHPYYSTLPPLYCPSPSHLSAYPHAYNYAPPPLSSYVVHPPSSGVYAQGDTADFGPHNTNNQAQGGGKPSRWKLSKIINAFVWNLSTGVLANIFVAGITG